MTRRSTAPRRFRRIQGSRTCDEQRNGASEQLMSGDFFALGRRQHVTGHDNENRSWDDRVILGKSVDHHGILHAVEGPTDRSLREILRGRRHKIGGCKSRPKSTILDVRPVDVSPHGDAEHLTDSRHHRSASPRRAEHQHGSITRVVILANDRARIRYQFLCHDLLNHFHRPL